MTIAYVATVQLLVLADSPDEAADAISHMLTPYEMGDGTLKDWAYLRVGEVLLTPSRVHIDLDNYEEGDFLC